MKEINQKELTKEIISVLAGELKVVRRFHEGWKEYQRAGCSGSLQKKFKNHFGKYQYIYTSKKGEISLVYIEVGGLKREFMWEIYAFDNDRVFQDVERFKLKKDAVKRIREVLL